MFGGRSALPGMIEGKGRGYHEKRSSLEAKKLKQKKLIIKKERKQEYRYKGEK